VWPTSAQCELAAVMVVAEVHSHVTERAGLGHVALAHGQWMARRC
jgi:hypothetical protein